MNTLISFLVAVVSIALVVGAVLYGINAMLGQWSTLAWLGLGWVIFIGIMQKINNS